MSFLLCEKVQTCLPCFSVSLWNQMRPRQLFSFVPWLSFKMMKIVIFFFVYWIFIFLQVVMFSFDSILCCKWEERTAPSYILVFCAKNCSNFCPPGSKHSGHLPLAVTEKEAFMSIPDSNKGVVHIMCRLAFQNWVYVMEIDLSDSNYRFTKESMWLNLHCPQQKCLQCSKYL